MKNLEIIKDSFEDKCTGCGACRNACPVGAITMTENREGFLSPSVDSEKCIECSKCERACPALNIKKDKKANSLMYAVRGSDEIRELSSSGGIFSIVSQYILENGGFVCGSAFDENMRLKHKIVSSAEELDSLRGSKYLQSDTGTVYKEIEALLKDNKKVFFVGTPCQVAGIYGYLGKDYPCLYTADILCHGVPSQKAFSSYLNSVSRGKKVKNVEFRNKRFGWSCENVLVTYEDGTESTHSRRDGDPYLRAFFENIDLRRSCAICNFSSSPRQGDISMGDFWGIDRVDPSQNDKKGTSMLTVNSEKGQELLDVIRKSATVSEYSYDATLPNRIHSHIPPHHLRRKFFRAFKDMSFIDAFNKTMDSKYDVGLVCNYGACNFGGSLTQYALYNTLEDMGFSTIMIERPKNAPEEIHSDLKTLIYRRWPFNATAPEYETKDDMRALNRICDSFVVGSDVLFRHSLYNLMGKISTLDWVESTKRKIAYAASYGYDYIVGDEQDTAEMSHFMKEFDAFGTREKSGVKLFKENFGVDATWVLDPVFLCDKKHYDTLIHESRAKKENNYICSYLLDPTQDKAEMLRIGKNTLGKSVTVFSEFERGDKPTRFTNILGEFNHVTYTVEERLECIKNCDFMIADSFHGICFAIIYNKNFICIVNKERGSTRFESILGLLGLTDRMVSSLDEVKSRPELFEPIDYEKVNGILASEKERCMEWLKNALTKEKRTDLSTYDVLYRAMKEENNRLNDKLNMLISLLGMNYMNEKDMFRFLDSLKDNLSRLTVAISAKDTPGMSISKELWEKLHHLGLKTNLTDKHWYGYSAIISNGKLVCESCKKDQRAICEYTKGNLTIRSEGAPLHDGNLSSIRVNGQELSQNSRGLNFVIISSQTGELIDSVAFDTHHPALPCKRK